MTTIGGMFFSFHFFHYFSSFFLSYFHLSKSLIIQRLRFNLALFPHDLFHLYKHSTLPSLLLLHNHIILISFFFNFSLIQFSFLWYNNNTTTMSTEKERETQVYLAKLSEQAERYEGDDHHSFFIFYVVSLPTPPSGIRRCCCCCFPSNHKADPPNVLKKATQH